MSLKKAIEEGLIGPDSENGKPKITITQEEYNKLVMAELFLDCLLAYDVTNWYLYKDAKDLFEMESSNVQK